MKPRKFTAWIWFLLVVLCGFVFWKAVLLKELGWNWDPRAINSTLTSLLQFTLGPRFIAPEMLALSTAIGYVLLRKRAGGADEIDVAISTLIVADFCATLLLLYGAHAVRVF